MAGSKSISPSRTARPRTPKHSDARLPSYSELDSGQSRESRAYMTSTTTTTVTTSTTRTTTFFSLPLWRRRAGPSMAASAMSEGLHMSTTNEQAAEHGRIARAASCNIDLNKKLPDVPGHEDPVDPVFARRSTGMMHFPSVQVDTEPEVRTGRSSRSSTFVSPQAQPMRTLAQAGLGIGLPHVMPSVASATKGASRSSASRPRTAPRPTRLEPTQEVRRVKSFSRVHAAATTRAQGEARSQTTKTRKPSATLDIPNGSNGDQRVVGRRASFWNRRRVQSLKGPSEAQAPLEQDTRTSPPPTLPAFRPISPMFPEKAAQTSSVSVPRPSNAQFHDLLRRHSGRSTSGRCSREESSFSFDLPPVPTSSQKLRSPTVGPQRHTPLSGDNSPLLEFQRRPVNNSFISSPSISRFPFLDQRQVRPRSMTNPPNVLQRLSKGFFNSSSPSSPISSPTASTSILDDIPVTSSPRHSDTPPRSSLSKSAIEIPKPRADEESPEAFLYRLEEAVSKAEIASILAGSGDLYYAEALRLYIDRFNFTYDPLDIALRKLLMDMGLPKETQQIDRVMEAFAARYLMCNPTLFVSEDHPYILAFSLIMLHTDAFNKSNKRKMTKADYIKNTKLVGVSTEVLDYFFDNTIFAPFIFIEDPVDVNGQRGFTQDGRTPSTGSGQVTPTLNGSLAGRPVLGRPNKVDAYYLITRNLLDGLRVDVETHIPLRNPFYYQGTAGSWNEAELRRSFARAEVIEVGGATDSRRMSSLPFFSMNATGVPGPVINDSALSGQESVVSEFSSLKITKVGLLNRKDDLLDGGKRASNRKWKELWSVILTGSQLLFYRDSAIALNLIVQCQSPDSESFPAQPSFLKPDELLSVKDTIAVYDSSYVKRDYVLRLVMPSGRQLLLQTENEMQRNEWIAHINYASAFKTAGIRMRPVSARESARMDRSSYIHGAPKIPLRDTPSISDEQSEEVIGRELIASSGITEDIEDLRSEGTLDVVSTTLHSRSRIVASKIQEFDSKIKAAQTQLESDIRLVHNLAILTPFQRSTRDRLQAAVVNLGRHIRQFRLDIVKATCFRDVLTSELASEERERRSRKREESEVSRRWNTEESPRTALSLSIDKGGSVCNGSSKSLSCSDISDLSHGRSASSICESFHSALDFGSDWPRANRFSAGVQQCIVPMRSFEEVSPVVTPSLEVPPGSPFGSGFFSSSSPAEPASGTVSSSPSVATDKSPVIAQRISVEEAEEWNKTRAAHRVSLVKVPTGLRTLDRGNRRTSLRLEETHDTLPSSGNNELYANAIEPSS